MIFHDIQSLLKMTLAFLENFLYEWKDNDVKYRNQILRLHGKSVLNLSSDIYWFYHFYFFHKNHDINLYGQIS